MKYVNHEIWVFVFYELIEFVKVSWDKKNKLNFKVRNEYFKIMECTDKQLKKNSVAYL